MNVFYTTTNGEPSGRASNHFRDEDVAAVKVNNQNVKAGDMGLETRYAVAEIDESQVADKKSIR